MATLTYNPNEQAEGELSTEEQEALEVGEKLAEQQSELLAGKFKDAEELEKGYIELQKKLGSQEEETKEETTETTDEVEEKENTGISTLKVGFNRVHGYFIEISRGQVENVPPNYIRRKTLKNTLKSFKKKHHTTLFF